MTVIADIYLEVNELPLETYGWRTVEGSYDELLNSPALRGDDLVMPNASGVRPYQRVVTVTLVSIPLLITGAFDEDGTPRSNPMTGMMVNRDALRSSLGIAGGDPDRGTVPAVFHRGDVSLLDWGGPVTVLGLNGFTVLDAIAGDAMVRLDLSIPDGELVEVGS